MKHFATVCVFQQLWAYFARNSHTHNFAALHARRPCKPLMVQNMHEYVVCMLLLLPLKGKDTQKAKANNVPAHSGRNC